jgi:hypothetical protein
MLTYHSMFFCSFYSNWLLKLPKFITRAIQFQNSWNFFHNVHMNVYYFIMIFIEFLVGWIFNGFRFLVMYAYLIPFAKNLVKWWGCIQWFWKFLWLFYTHSCLFWYKVCGFLICGLRVVIFWSRVWQLVSHHGCVNSWILLTCFLASNWPKLLHKPSLICLVDLWFFWELIVLFSICLRFFLPV